MNDNNEKSPHVLLKNNTWGEIYYYGINHVNARYRYGSIVITTL